MSLRAEKGFTLIEIVVSFALLALISFLVIFAFSSFQRQVDLDTTSQGLVSTLRLARSKTLGSEGKTAYGVHFETDRYILFTGSSYTAGDSENKEFILSNTDLQWTLVGGGDNVIFDRIRGTTSETGQVTTRLLTDTSKTAVVRINSSGQVSLNDTLTPTSTRLVDGRHLRFNLGWSIQNATTLRFNFSGVNHDVAMAGFFNGPKTEFDWSGSFAVNGEDQELKVHTRSLDAFNTTLSVHHDRRFTDEALTISIIDGGVTKQIVSYPASCTASSNFPNSCATASAYGGTMSLE